MPRPHPENMGFGHENNKEWAPVSLTLASMMPVTILTAISYYRYDMCQIVRVLIALSLTFPGMMPAMRPTTIMNGAFSLMFPGTMPARY